MILQVQTIERKMSLTQALPIELISYFIKKKRTKKKKKKKKKKKRKRKSVLRGIIFMPGFFKSQLWVVYCRCLQIKTPDQLFCKESNGRVSKYNFLAHFLLCLLNIESFW